jgi:hypothetical protein
MVAAGAATLRWTAPTAGVLDELTALAAGDAPPVDRVVASLASAPPPSKVTARELLQPSAERAAAGRVSAGDALSAAIHAAADVGAVLAMLAADAPSGPLTGGLRRAVMHKARWFNEELGAVDDAIALWTAVARRSADDEELRHVIAVMMAVANQWADAGWERPRRDVRAAARIHAAVYGLHVSPDQDGRVLRTMTDVANRITRVDGPRERFDAEGAACLWRAVAHLGGPEDARRAARTIMSVANQLTPQGRPWRVAEAVQLWRAAAEVGAERDRVLRTVMLLANARSRDHHGVAEAADLIVAAGQIVGGASDDEALRVVRTLMVAANSFVDLDRPDDADVTAAGTLWAAAGDVRGAAEDHARAARTAWGLGNDAWGRGHPRLALSLWIAAWSLCDPTGPEALRLVKSTLDIAGRTPASAEATLALLDGAPPPLERALRTGLLYYAARYDEIVTAADASPTDLQLRALAADARRKQRDLDDAWRRATAVVEAAEVAAGLAGSAVEDALVSACCCLGFVSLERLRSGVGPAQVALDWFERARAAVTHGAVPPRAWMGTSFVLDLLGDSAGASDARSRAAEVDPDNHHAALDALSHTIAARAAAEVEVTVRLPAALVPPGISPEALAADVVAAWVRSRA